MPDLQDLPDITLDDAAFQAAYPDYVVEHKNRNPRWTIRDFVLRAVAQGVNFWEGITWQLRSEYHERRVLGRVRVGATDIYRTTVAPENVIAAPPGSLALQTDGTVWRKASGTGTTGWVTMAADAASIVAAFDTTYYDVDFAKLPTNDFADGNEVIDVETWVCGARAAADTWGVAEDLGIEFNAASGAGGNTVLTSTNVSASRIRIDLATLIGASFDPFAAYLIECHWSTLTLGTTGNRTFLGLYRDVAGADSLVAGGRSNLSGNQRVYTQVDTTISHGEADASDDDCVALLVDRHGAMVLSGRAVVDEDAEFPELSDYTDRGYAPAPQVSSFSLLSGYLMLANVTGETGGNMATVTRMLRIRRVLA